MRVALIHPDLGLGGAERLVLDMASALSSLGHAATIFTPHHDPSRSFLSSSSAPSVRVRVIPTLIPRTILSRFHALLALARLSIVTLYVILIHRPHVAVVDLVSFPVLLLFLFRVPVLFYCHFPDPLLYKSLIDVDAPRSRLVVLYRALLDFQDALSMRLASLVLVNSRFTAAAFQSLHPTLPPPSLVYPCVPTPSTSAPSSPTPFPTPYILSLNRFESKKNLLLAIDAFAIFLSRLPNSLSHTLSLVLAGGYDTRLSDNRLCYATLQNRILHHNLSTRVHLLTNISDSRRTALLTHARALVYTPSHEHFGIVPLEAMALSVPVVAVDSGGPRETIQDSVTGFLCPASPPAFADALVTLIQDPQLASRMGRAARARVNRLFSTNVLKDSLHKALSSLDLPSH